MPHRRLVALLSGAVVASTLLAPTTGPAHAATRASEGAYPGGVRMVQANLLSRQSARRTLSDVRTVLSVSPDVITYNEVPERTNQQLAPAGYGIYRGQRNRYTRATAVAWRSDRWHQVDHGTYRFSNYRRKPEGRKVKLGIRFANWVTLEARNGRRMSVIAVHVAPDVQDMPDLLRRSVRRIGDLVARRAPDGPVLVGGDFNVHYTSGRYPRGLLEAARMRPTYDTLGSYFPTGDHYGATIDYVFNRGKAKLRAERHRRIELRSDHDAVVADLGWRVDAPG
ncbi:endonuclease/exonuclease/phosphatase family protein [Nocardioides sp. GXQ0305]|uniref:endonuclease/exonuclease/phosphatase family protein n=1 Tax=Nocardioides sp. GXQ0305 TaxID=3423912 RepID=UPI003D7E7EC3